MRPLGIAVWNEAARSWQTGGRAVRTAAAVGIVLMAIGLTHGLAFMLLGGAWQGEIGWRKPFAFGLSFGLTTVTVAWIVSRLHASPAARWWLLAPVAAAATVEVGWVSVQRARSVPSHFNTATPADELAFGLAGGGAIAVMITALVAVTVLAWVRPDAPPALCSAIRGGLAILLISQAIGGWMIQRGIESMTTGGPASHAIGAAGDLKVVHAVAMHAIQLLPVLALGLLAGMTSESLARTVVRLAGAGYALLTAAALAQASSGRAVTSPTVTSLILAAVAVAILSATGTLAVVAARRHPRGGVSVPA